MIIYGLDQNSRWKTSKMGIDGAIIHFSALSGLSLGKPVSDSNLNFGQHELNGSLIMSHASTVTSPSLLRSMLANTFSTCCIVPYIIPRGNYFALNVYRGSYFALNMYRGTHFALKPHRDIYFPVISCKIIL